MSFETNYYYKKELYRPAHKIIDEIFTDFILAEFYNKLLEIFKDKIPYTYTDQPYEIDGEIYRDLVEESESVYDFFSSSVGWHDALEMLLENHPNLKTKYHNFYYKNIDNWMDADTFDGDIEEKLSDWYKKNIVGKNSV